MMNKHYAEEFAQKGYTIINSLFSNEEVIQLKQEALTIVNKIDDIDNSGVFLGLTSRSQLFKQAAANQELVNALKEIIGSYVVFMNDKLVFKNSTKNFGSPWHQDYPYWQGSHKYSVWIALDDATKENGCLQVVPGSHLFGEKNHGADSSDGLGFVNRLHQEDIDKDLVIDLPAKQGDAIIFHDLLYHASYPNISGADRWALISTYKDGTQEDPEYKWASAAFIVSEA
ncbi:hypothetical protein GC102_23515 [Paenibacillus sp. LMG 31460]|uniref:Phytanoyl-CoA dioxygenase family protein n=1 Tax=Paenibacillus germinis TaxID=2654979 RepID=A0ABX1Z5P0_9BACL|nr:phytanoyl-CoA dioxygenase family protein [Paenibacillus germinis]NOU88695.1 hypothetical protein [Paenibacillus germinis]